jgi:hypothetical protein
LGSAASSIRIFGFHTNEGLARVRKLAWVLGLPTLKFAPFYCQNQTDWERDEHNFFVCPKFEHFQQRIFPGQLKLEWPKVRQREQRGPVTEIFEFETWAERSGTTAAMMGAEISLCRCMQGACCSFRKTRSTSLPELSLVFPNRERFGRTAGIEKAPN